MARPGISRRSRFPYTVVAWYVQDPRRTASLKTFAHTFMLSETCQKRKTKCSGGQPCARCCNSKEPCLYPRKTRFRSAGRTSYDHHLQKGAQSANRYETSRTLEEQMPWTNPRTAVSNLKQPSLAAGLRDIDSVISTCPPNHSNPKSLSHTAGSRLTIMDPGTSGNPKDAKHGVLRVIAKQIEQVVTLRTSLPTRSILDAFDMDSWVDILQTYKEEVGLQYPILEIDQWERNIRRAKCGTASVHTRTDRTKPQPRQRVDDTAILILAVVSSFSSAEATGIVYPLVEDIASAALARTHFNNVDKNDLTLLVLSVCSL